MVTTIIIMNLESTDKNNICFNPNNIQFTKSSSLLSRIRKTFLENLKLCGFQKFKQDAASKELEQIKILNIKPGEGLINMIVLKEKFVYLLL